MANLKVRNLDAAVASALRARASAAGAVGRGEIRLADDERCIDAALTLATLMNHKVADCIYVALAEQEGAALATADRRLAALAEQRGVTTSLLA
jgi:predicted nucleic acid-binding protein